MSELIQPRTSILVDENNLPPILYGQDTPTMREKVERFYLAIPEMLERWISRCRSPHTRKAYRQDLFSLIEYLEIRWPEDSLRLLELTVADVQRWQDAMAAGGRAPKTLNRRVSSVASFFRFLQAAASEMRLPIVVPNPAHSQFIARSTTDPVQETKSLSATRARQLMGLPQGESLVAYRDRAILKWFLFSGVRLNTACRLKIDDFHVDGDEATIRIQEKGGRHRRIGLHFAAAEAISQYIQQAEIRSGPLFRPRSGPRSRSLADRHLSADGMHRIVKGYLAKLPGALVTRETPDGNQVEQCLYSTHSLRATTATLLLNAGVEISKVQELLGHRHISTTQIYDKRRRTTSESASHDVPI